MLSFFSHREIRYEMLKPIRHAMGKSFTSFDTLADAVMKAAPSLEWPARRSLSAKIGELDRGIRTWWQRRPTHRKALLELLGIPDADIGVFESKSDEHIYHFKDFPELPPLHLPREAVFRIGRAEPIADAHSASSFEDWLKYETIGESRRVEPTGTIWLHMADGLGRSLLFAELAAKHGLTALRVHTLADSSNHLEDPRPLVIKLEEQASTSDLRNLLRRPREAGLLIIAPSPFPQGNTQGLSSWFSWEFLSKEKGDRTFFALSNPNSNIGLLNDSLNVASLRWRLDRDWQNQLLQWIDTRLSRLQPDTYFCAEGLKGWIDDFDPLRQWISTPEELMVLCRISHRKRYLDLPKASDRRVADALMEAAISLKPGQRRVFRKLAERRWQTVALPWRGALPETEWRSLARGTESVTQEALLAIAEAPNRERRKEMARIVAEQSCSGVIDTLIEDDYLKHEGMAHYDLWPPALANLVVRDWLLEKIITAPLNTWAFACFDATRRRLVDATLDCLSIDELAVLAELACNESPWAAETIAASESLILAIGRRLANGAHCTDSMSRCFAKALSRLENTDSFPARFPLTRSRDSEDDQLAWLVACWAYSLTPRPPEIQLTPDDAWLFPGWFEDSPDRSGWLVAVQIGEYDGLKFSWRSLNKLGLRLCNHWKTPPADPPEFMEPLLLLAAARGRWSANPVWWRSVMNNGETENAFLVELKQGGHDAARRLWPSFLHYEKSCAGTDILEISQYLNCVCSASRIWILGRLSPEEVLASLEDKSLLYIRRNPSSFPPAVRRALLDQTPRNAPEAITLLTLCDDLDGDELADWLGGVADSVAAERIWARPHGEILRVINRLSVSDKEKGAFLMSRCPDNQIELAVDALQKNPGLLSLENRRQWVRDRLANSGPHAPLLVKIMLSN